MDMTWIIEDYKAIASRQRQIGIEEGHIICTRCKSLGFYEYCDEEGAIYWTVCDACKNPLNLRPPTATGYQG
jgi:hypothetical protein